MPMKRSYDIVYLIAISMSVLFFIVCEIITYELPNVLDSNLCFKMKVKDVTIRMKIGRRTLLVSMHTCAKIGDSRSSRLFAVHNRTHRELRTPERTSTQPARITPFQLPWNGVKHVYTPLERCKTFIYLRLHGHIHVRNPTN